MSYLAALPSRDGIILASDSRITIGDEQTIVDRSPKFLVLGDFALGTSGRSHDVSGGTPVDFEHAALSFWKTEGFHVHEDSWDRFGKAMLALVRQTRPVPDENSPYTGFLVAQAISADEQMIGQLMIALAGANDPHIRHSELWRFRPETPLRMLSLHAGDGDAVRDAMANVPRPVLTTKGRQGLDEADGAAYLVDVLRAVTKVETLIGGAFSVTVLHPTSHKGHDVSPAQKVSRNLKEITSMSLETQAATQSAGAKTGRLYYQTTEQQIHVDNGSAIARVPTLTSLTRGDLIRVGSAANQWVRLALAAAGRFLQSDGTDIGYSAYTLPTSVSATGTILRSDGTNYVGTTATYPATAAAGTVLYAGAANVVSATTMGSGVTVLTTGNVTTTNGSMVNITGLSVTITKAFADTKLIVGGCWAQSNDGGVSIEGDIHDGTNYLFGDGSTSPGFSTAAGNLCVLSYHRVLTGYAAGAVTFQARFRSNGAATTTAYATAGRKAIIWAQEVA